MASGKLSLVPTNCERELKMKNSERKVLDEDTYIANVGKIIVRDFFPDLPKLKAEFDSNKSTDTPSVCGTPSVFGTPESSAAMTPKIKNKDEEGISQSRTKNPETEVITDDELAKMSLDKYMHKYTSEDNVSFNEIIAEAQKKHEAKHAWLYKNEQPMIEGGSGNNKPEMWKYVPKNYVMYIPEGMELSLKEKLEKSAGKKQEIIHSNTRFTVPPFIQPTTETFKVLPNRSVGRIGLDGKEILPSRTPTMGGYKFMGTPSPAPGVDASPLMTWGEIEGTPFKLDGSETPRIGTPSTGSVFRIPELPKRDRLLLQLTEKISRSHRAKKEEALRQATATFASSPRSFMSKTERLQSMSPAARRLVTNKLRLHSNSPFNSSYTPTPGRTPTNGISTPKSSPRVRPKRTSDNLTDDLLKLPEKRPSAADFF